MSDYLAQSCCPFFFFFCLYTVADSTQFHIQSVDVISATSEDFPGPCATVFPTTADRSFHDHTVQGQASCWVPQISGLWNRCVDLCIQGSWLEAQMYLCNCCEALAETHCQAAFNLSLSYSFHQSLYHKSLFLKAQLKLYPHFLNANPEK